MVVGSDPSVAWIADFEVFETPELTVPSAAL
jgi:hypothetical protein